MVHDTGHLPRGWRIYAEPPLADGSCRLRLIAPNGTYATWTCREQMPIGQVIASLAADQKRDAERGRPDVVRSGRPR